MIHQMLLSLILGLFPSSAGMPQPLQSAGAFTIQGTVLTPDGRPLPNCVLRAEHAADSTLSDDKGKFSLSSKDPCVTLIATHRAYGALRQANVCANKPITLRFEIPREEQRAEDRKHLLQMSTRMAAPAPYMMTTPAVPGQPVTWEPAYMNTDEYAHIQENRFHRATDEPLSTFSIDVDAASYSNLRGYLKNGQMPPPDAVRIEEMINYFDYDYPGPKDGHPFAVHTELGPCPWNPQHQLLAIGLQGKRIAPADLPPSNLVFLIDVSGSMDAPNRLPLVQASFRMLTEQLRPADRVAIVVYAGAAGLVLPPTPGNDKKTILAAIDKLNAGGSTAGGAGIQLAYRIAKEQFMATGNNRVILATDGDFNVGVSSEGDLVRLIEQERESGVFLTVLGYGMGNYKDNKMQNLANKGNGNHYYIDEIEEAKKVLVREFGGTLFTIAKDVKLQVEFNPAKVQGYRLVGYENRVLNKEDFNDDRKDAGELGAGHTVTALYEIIPQGVQSGLLGEVDPLKYQPKAAPAPEQSDEWLTIKLRYKEPQGDQSKLLQQTVKGKAQSWEASGAAFQWAAAVAEFGLLLRDSGFKGSATYEHCFRIAQQAAAKGTDAYGYRAECIKMMDTAMRLGHSNKHGEEANKH